MNIFKNTNSPLIRLIKGVFFSCITALALTLLVSAFCSIFGASKNLLSALSIIIKVASVGVCAFIFSTGSRGIINGIISGAASWLSLFILFFILSGGVVGEKIGLSAIFCLIFGIIFGIIFANLKKTVNNS